MRVVAYWGRGLISKSRHRSNVMNTQANGHKRNKMNDKPLDVLINAAIIPIGAMQQEA
jgi:hypothetical protein